jgi:23S rRNA (cytidine2498-2'-O)-methyltransferase
MSVDAAQFLFMTCQPGAEAALKEEIARREPAWRPAFSRPGFVTFKNPKGPIGDVPLAARSWIFARTCGIALGQVTGTQLVALAGAVWQDEHVVALLTEDRLADVHVWQRDAMPPGAEPDESVVTPLAAEIEAAVRAAAPEGCDKLRREVSERRRPTRRGGRVLDVVVIEPHQSWIGYHRAASLPQRWPGGVIPVRMPAHAVSRAYAKMEEALAWSGLPLTAGDECVEVGCAPGGASQALLDRGLFVTGIDPAEVDPAVLAHPHFRHLRQRGKDVRRHEFEGVQWLAADMNVAPQYTLDTIEAIVTHPDVTIRGLVLTLKLADWSLSARLPEFAERVRGWGYRDVRVRQLASGGQEVCLVALKRKALRRLGGKRKRKRKERGAEG